MEYYNQEQVQNALNETYAFIEIAQDNNCLYLTLNRPEKKNALHPQMVNEMAFALTYAKYEKSVWFVVLQANGDYFCSGADLKAFMGMTGEFNSSIPEPTSQVLIAELLKKVYKPIITKLHGDIMAGGLFFLAGSQYVIANKNVHLGLPEVKRGLFPFQVMASLMEVLPRRTVLDWCISGKNIDAKTAHEWGLITDLVEPNDLENKVNDLIAELAQNSPKAISLGLEAYDTIFPSTETHAYLMGMLQKAASSKDGMEGMMAFREKRKPVWRGE